MRWRRRWRVVVRRTEEEEEEEEIMSSLQKQGPLLLPEEGW